MKAQAVMHKKTGDLKEMTKSWMGWVIWLMDYDKIPKGSLAVWPYLIYNDDVRFKDYEIVGAL